MWHPRYRRCLGADGELLDLFTGLIVEVGDEAIGDVEVLATRLAPMLGGVKCGAKASIFDLAPRSNVPNSCRAALSVTQLWRA
jgi:hypothetical protein